MREKGWWLLWFDYNHGWFQWKNLFYSLCVLFIFFSFNLVLEDLESPRVLASILCSSLLGHDGTQDLTFWWLFWFSVLITCGRELISRSRAWRWPGSSVHMSGFLVLSSSSKKSRGVVSFAQDLSARILLPASAHIFLFALVSRTRSAHHRISARFCRRWNLHSCFSRTETFPPRAQSPAHFSRSFFCYAAVCGQVSFLTPNFPTVSFLLHLKSVSRRIFSFPGPCALDAARF
jgi:hypothetical protein